VLFWAVLSAQCQPVHLQSVAEAEQAGLLPALSRLQQEAANPSESSPGARSGLAWRPTVRPVDSRRMERLSEQELVDRAGSSPKEIRRLADLRILVADEGDRPYTVGDVRRVRLARACEQGGIPLEAIGRAIREGRLSFAFLDVSQYSIFSELSGTTFEDVERSTAIPLHVLAAIREALGVGRPEPTDRVRGDDLEVISSVQLALAAGVPHDVVIRLMRVYRESLRRIADAETAIYHSYFELPLLRSGMAQGQIMETASAAGEQFAGPMDRTLLAAYHRQQEHSWTADMIEHVEAAVEEAGLAPRVERPPAMCFLDLAGYTRLTDERGDRAAAEIATSLSDLVAQAAFDYRGRAVKWVGDGVMFHFPHPGPAVRSALNLVDRAPSAGLPPAHAGVDAGPVIFQDGDFYGRTVNMASRVCDRAAPGQVLVTERVVHLCAEDPSDGIRFEELGPTRLKGVTGPAVLFQAVAG